VANNFSPEDDNYEKLFNGLGVLYVYIGTVIEQKYMGTYKYAEWYDTSFKT